MAAGKRTQPGDVDPALLSEESDLEMFAPTPPVPSATTEKIKSEPARVAKPAESPMPAEAATPKAATSGEWEKVPAELEREGDADADWAEPGRRGKTTARGGQRQQQSRRQPHRQQHRQRPRQRETRKERQTRQPERPKTKGCIRVLTTRRLRKVGTKRRLVTPAAQHERSCRAQSRASPPLPP